MPMCHRAFVCCAVLAILLGNLRAAAAGEKIPPTDWIEPETGHRVVRLSTEPGTESLYFHQNEFTAEGDKMLVSTPTGLATITLAPGMTSHTQKPLVEGRTRGAVVGRKSRTVYYMSQ